MMDGGPGQQGLLAAACLESDEQPTRNEDKAPVSFDGRWAKLVLKLVSQNNIQTNTHINATCLNRQENSAHRSHLSRGPSDRNVFVIFAESLQPHLKVYAGRWLRIGAAQVQKDQPHDWSTGA